MDKVIIEALKENLATLRGMDGDLRRAMESIGKKNFIFLLSDGTWDNANPKQGWEYEIYRLRPDYQPEPELVECEVYKNTNGYLVFDNKTKHADTTTSIKDAICCFNFIGFKYEDGNVYPQPVMYSEEGGLHFISQVDKLTSGKDIVNRPTHVLFKGGE